VGVGGWVGGGGWVCVCVGVIMQGEDIDRVECYVVCTDSIIQEREREREREYLRKDNEAEHQEGQGEVEGA